MSAAEPSKTSPSASAPDPTGGDPSMEDILASIRRILSEDEATADVPSQHEPGHPPEIPPPQDAVHHGRPDKDLAPPDLLILDASMMVPEPGLPSMSIPVPPIPPSVPLMNSQNTDPSSPLVVPSLVAPGVAAAAASSIGSMVRNIVADRATQIHSGGPTLDDIVREELRPLLKQWLDEHLPGMVERLVQVELERVISRSAS